jgi:hypothetical protein
MRRRAARGSPSDCQPAGRNGLPIPNVELTRRWRWLGTISSAWRFTGGPAQRRRRR